MNKEKADPDKEYTCSTSPNGKAVTYTFNNFMLTRPEPIKKSFTVHNLGVIRGSLRRTEIYN